ncbi:HD domain-containing protein [Halobacillus sp. Marseille-P3879]|uniref:HD domain-containing protein n=1 Tax=Halobacillus sp. Marseille-P3879 TaxID=2045014 RepID=UPI000C7C4B99|nr:HD domain-containing protein [Halobacillus sp. Marseille-P3879]
MDCEKIIYEVNNYITRQFANDPTGHDYNHMKRVAEWSRLIALDEGADPFTAELSGWVHDIGDAKLFQDTDAAYQELDDFLKSLNVNVDQREVVFAIIRDISFSKGRIPDSIEGKIVQDADRLDALGAIGIARTFAYGGMHNQLIYHEEEQKLTSIQHFYDKLLKLSQGMHTRKARQEAEQRHIFMKKYLEQFFKEWNSIERAGE